MSNATTDTPALDIREQIMRIDRAIAETQKFLAETGKLQRERGLAPFIAGATLVGGLGGAFAGVMALFRITGHG